MLKRIVITTILGLLCFLIVAYVPQKKGDKSHVTTELTCEDCHTCKNPTKVNPCLRACPRHWLGKTGGRELSPDQAPDVVILKELEDLYNPVRFPHKLHAEMADMGEGCIACHHHTPTEASHPPCKECHSPTVIRKDMEKPGLKGAYHRQCMGCHREWSEGTECEVCHALKDRMQAEGDAYVAPHYRPCKEPEKKVYQTDMDEGPYVTFFHTNHSKMYGLDCSSCHQDQPCIVCHYQGEKPGARIDALIKEGHEKCSDCHDTDDDNECKKCHAKTEKKGFDHGQATGWPLNIYHQKLSCNSCHPAGKPIGKLSRTCNNCHKNWNSENFNHSVVGIELDENHVDADCSDCHLDRRFDKKPDCSNCHDETPEGKPGTKTKKGN